MSKEHPHRTDFFARHPELRLPQEIIGALIKDAIIYREKAYAPYSHYAVGAAVLTTSGKIFGGFNIESATYTTTFHAEQVAIIRALVAGEAKGGREIIKAMVIVHKGNTMPCGICRQTIKEFCDEALIINANPEGKILGISCLSELLPHAFGPSDLEVK